MEIVKIDIDNVEEIVQVEIDNTTRAIKSTTDIIKKGYSPYIDETTGNWMEWDDYNKKFIDTGIHAKGEPGEATLEYIAMYESVVSNTRHVDEVVDEFDTHVVNKTTEIDEHVENKIIEFDEHAQSKTLEFIENANNELQIFDSNAITETQKFNQNVKNKLDEYNANHLEKISAYNQNSSSKTNSFNKNSETKTSAFNDNATDKTNSFNSNVITKTNTANQSINTTTSNSLTQIETKKTQSINSIDAKTSQSVNLINDTTTQSIDSITPLVTETKGYRDETKVLKDEVEVECEQVLIKYEKVVEQLKTIRLVSLEKVEDYLYNINYDLLDYNYANEYFKNTKDTFALGSCSSISKDGLYGRNYDWTYDETVEFVIKTPANNSRHATIGIGLNPKLTKELVESGEYNEAYRILPFILADGINDSGVVCNINVVPKDKGEANGTDLCSLMIPRFVLDNFSTAQEAVNYLRTQSIYTPKSIHDMGYEVHFMIGDKDKTFVVELVNGQVVILEKSFMTNFYLHGVTFNQNGSVATPANGDAISTNKITEYGSGLERYNLINSYTGSIGQLMNKLKFTNTYNRTTNPFWYSEFVGGNIKVNSSISLFEPRVNEYIEKFNSRIRNGETWQTVHSSIYDLNAKTLSLKVQEGNNTHLYSVEFNEELITDYNDLENKPKINNVELVGNKTTNDLGLFDGDYDSLLNKPTIPTKTSDLSNDSNFIQDNNYVHTDNNYSDIEKTRIKSLEDNKADKITTYTKTEVDDKITEAKPAGYEQIKLQVSTNKSNIESIELDIPNLSLITETGNKIDLEIDSTTYVLKAKLFDKNNNLLSTSQDIDLPLETLVLNVEYDSAKKSIIITLKDGTTKEVPVGDLVSGLVNETTLNSELAKKQNIISDLDDIRDGASLGKTSIQSLVGYATEQWVLDKNYLTSIPETYAKKIDILTKTSELTNDSNFVSDSSYVHTDNNFTTLEKIKLSNLENYDDNELRQLILGISDSLVELQTKLNSLIPPEGYAYLLVKKGE